MPRLLLLSFLLRWLRYYCGVLFAANVFALPAISPAPANDESGGGGGDEKHKNNICRSYLAPSTLPGAGLGMFAGRDFDFGEEITPGDLVVPIVDIAYHNQKGYLFDLPFLWDEYTWSASMFVGMTYESNKVSAASFGLGACPNHFFPLVNLGDADEYSKVDSRGLRLGVDPGAGAFTSYHDRKGVALDQIPQGMELFMNYGSSYWVPEEKYRWMPNKNQEFNSGDTLLRTFVSLRQILQDNLGLPTVSLLANSTINLLHEIKRIWQSTVLYTLPEDADQVDHIVNIGVRKLHYNRSIQSLDWLTKNGLCSDHLQPGPSTIRQAGRGAFTRRPIAKGQVIAPGPLIQIADRRMLDMYLPNPASGEFERNMTEVQHKQLLLNYCFGHKLLSILLCPYGVATGLINHSKEKVNAKIAWSHKLMKRPEWLKQHPSEWAHLQHSGLAIEYVATRDLDANEEVFIDYGDEWQKAWDDHKARWSQHRNVHVGNKEIVQSEIGNVVIPTVHEVALGTKYQELRCREIFRRWWGLYHFPGDHYPCHAIDRYEKDGETVYNVEILIRDQDWEEGFCAEELEEVLFGVPQDIFVVEDELKARHQSFTFRHDMRIPDELVPQQWLVALSQSRESNEFAVNSSSSLCSGSQIATCQGIEIPNASDARYLQESILSNIEN